MINTMLLKFCCFYFTIFSRKKQATADIFPQKMIFHEKKRLCFVYFAPILSLQPGKFMVK